MRILQINNFHYLEGGTERYYLNVSTLMRKHGHEVAFFSTLNPRNSKSRWSQYFVSYLSVADANYKSWIEIIKRMIYSNDAKKKINELLDSYKPDIVHIHNIYNHISPSILPEIKKRNIPIIQTLHDYHLLAPNRILFHDGKICEVTKVHKYYQTVLHRCIRKSYIMSFLVTLTFYLHKYLRLYSRYIDLYIAPSNFMKSKMIEYGFNPKKIKLLPYFVNLQNQVYRYRKKEKFVLYFGRIYPEKGLIFLIEVMRKLPDIKFKIIGKGTQDHSLKKKIQEFNLKNVELIGYLSGDRLTKEISECCFTILPSVWYENLPNSILESFAHSKPVIASNLGGIPELVKPGKTGLLFEAGNSDDCSKKILTFWNNPKLVDKLGTNAYKYTVDNFDPYKHYIELMKIYSIVLN